MERILLNWEKIKHYKQLTKDANLPGVYIWGFYGGEDFIPYYVGKALSVWHRLGQHLVSLKGGGATIYLPQYFSNFRKYKKEDYLYCPYGPDQIIEFLDNKDKQLQSSLKFMIDNFHFTYALTEKEFLTDLEKSVINSIGKENLINTKSGIPKAYRHKNSGDETVCNILES